MIFARTITGKKCGYELPYESNLNTVAELFAKVVGYNHNPAHRPELQGQPKLEGLMGPFFNGYIYDAITGEEIPVIRYETREQYCSMD